MAMKARYTVVNGDVIAQKRSGARHLYTPDPLGSTVALINSSQTKTDTWNYWPYGEVKSRTGTTVTPFQFVGTLGYYQDSATNTYVRARYLNVQKGRWATEDPIYFKGRDFNLYAYAYNRPLVLVDPSGLLPRCFWECLLSPAWCLRCLLSGLLPKEGWRRCNVEEEERCQERCRFDQHGGMESCHVFEDNNGNITESACCCRDGDCYPVGKWYPPRDPGAGTIIKGVVRRTPYGGDIYE